MQNGFVRFSLASVGVSMPTAATSLSDTLQRLGRSATKSVGAGGT